jgi:hypothetical protein
LQSVVKSITPSAGSVTQQAQSGGKTGVIWKGFSVANNATATLTVKVAKPAAGSTAALGLYCTYTPAPESTLITSEVKAP